MTDRPYVTFNHVTLIVAEPDHKKAYNLLTELLSRDARVDWRTETLTDHKGVTRPATDAWPKLRGGTDE